MALLEKNSTEELSRLAELDPRWAEVERVVSSRTFARAGRLSAFLLYVARCELENRTREITEQQIGIHVFGRNPGYNSSEDNIVRATARLLRQRLAFYYQEEGGANDLRIHIPRGGYVPSFQPRYAELDPVPAEPETAASIASSLPSTIKPLQTEPELEQIVEPRQEEAAEVQPSGIHTSRVRAALPYAAVLILGALLALLGQYIAGRMLHGSVTDPLWASLFAPGQTTLFVPGDAGLNMYNNLAHMPQSLPLRDYIQGHYIPSTNTNETSYAGIQFAARRYVNIADLELADLITSTRGFRREHYRVHFPRDITAEDLHNVNVILSGAPVYNPWIELFDSRLNFHFLYNNANGSNRMIVENQHPLKGEPASYEASRDHGYGSIAFTDNPNGGGKALVIQGTSHVGIEAAVEFLFNDAKMAPVMAKAREGGQLANFEIFLQTDFMNGNSANTVVLSTRFHSKG